jgi:hypothetical protein
MLKMLSDHPGLDAVSVCHEQTAGADNLVSQYWNALIRFGEERQAGTGGNLASPCAAIRRDVFLSAGMYDEWRFGTARLEGIEFGHRLEDSGRNVFSSRDLSVTGLRRWNLRSLCREVWGRSTLLTRSLGYQRTRTAVPGDVVFTLSRALAPAVALVCFLSVSAAFLPTPNTAIKTAIVLLAAVALNSPAYVYFAKARGFAFALVAAPLHLLAQAVNGLGLCTGWVLRDMIGDREPDAATQAYAEVGVEIWPPIPRASSR